MVLQTLVFVASFLFICNKVFLLVPQIAVKEKMKWSFGLLAAVLFIIYFFCIGSPILSTLEIGLTVLSLYRTVVGAKRSPLVEKILGFFTGAVIFALFLMRYKGYVETIQLFGALGMLFGTFGLITDRKMIGFTLYALGHIFTAMYGYQKRETIFWSLQAFQALLCLTVFLPENVVRVTMILYLFIAATAFGIFVYLLSPTAKQKCELEKERMSSNISAQIYRIQHKPMMDHEDSVSLQRYKRDYEMVGLTNCSEKND